MKNLEFMKKFRPNELCVKEFKYCIEDMSAISSVQILKNRLLNIKSNKDK